MTSMIPMEHAGEFLDLAERYFAALEERRFVMARVHDALEREDEYDLDALSPDALDSWDELQDAQAAIEAFYAEHGVPPWVTDDQ